MPVVWNNQSERWARSRTLKQTNENENVLTDLIADFFKEFLLKIRKAYDM